MTTKNYKLYLLESNGKEDETRTNLEDCRWYTRTSLELPEEQHEQTRGPRNDMDTTCLPYLDVIISVTSYRSIKILRQERQRWSAVLYVRGNAHPSHGQA